MAIKTCPDCDAPIRQDCLPVGECWWFGQYEERMRRDGNEDQIEGFRKSGVDPPCTGNNYDYNERNRIIERNGVIAVIIVIFVIIVMAAWYYGK